MEWIHLAQDRDQLKTLVNNAMKLRVPQHSEKFLSTRVTEGFFRRTHFRGVRQYVQFLISSYFTILHLQRGRCRLCSPQIQYLMSTRMILRRTTAAKACMSPLNSI
jgi:hypothetical protein